MGLIVPGELKHTLPGMVVDVLEIQLEKHYVDYLADMVMKEMDRAPDVTVSPGDKDQKDSRTGTKMRNECMEVPSSWIDMEPHTVSNKDIQSTMYSVPAFTCFWRCLWVGCSSGRLSFLS